MPLVTCISLFDGTTSVRWQVSYCLGFMAEKVKLAEMEMASYSQVKWYWYTWKKSRKVMGEKNDKMKRLDKTITKLICMLKIQVLYMAKSSTQYLSFIGLL